MRHKILAQGVMVAHILWTALIIGGTFAIVTYRWYIPWHISVIASTAGVNIIFRTCPLTALEERFRRKYDPSATLNNAFLATYIERLTTWHIPQKHIDRVRVSFQVLSFALALVLWI